MSTQRGHVPGERVGVERDTGDRCCLGSDFDQSRPVIARSIFANNGSAAVSITWPASCCSRSITSDFTSRSAPSTISGTAASARPPVATAAAWSATKAVAMPTSTAAASAFCAMM